MNLSNRFQIREYANSLWFHLLILLAVISLYWSIIPSLVRDLWNDPNYSHGLLVPFFSGYLIWEKRKSICLADQNENTFPGFLLVFFSMVMVVLGKAGVEYYTMRSSLVILIAGLFYIIFGRKGFKECLFPLAFLIYIVPLPYILYDSIAFPLRMLASSFGEIFLSILNIPVYRDGNIIILPNLQLEVVDACSGIRSLISITAMAVVSAHILKIGFWKGLILFLSAIPISVFTNSFRIIITGILSYKYGKQMAEGFFHEFSGIVIFLMGVTLIFALGYIFKKNMS